MLRGAGPLLPVAVIAATNLAAAPSGGCGHIKLRPGVTVLESSRKSPQVDSHRSGVQWVLAEEIQCIGDEASYYSKGGWTDEWNWVVGISWDPEEQEHAAWDRLQRQGDNACFVSAETPCFRGVFDLALPDHVLAELSEGGDMGSIEDGVGPGTQLVAEQVSSAMREKFGVGALELAFYAHTLTPETDDFNGQLMHTDLVSNGNYWYTALLYTSQAGYEFDQGGHTVFVDTAHAVGEDEGNGDAEGEEQSSRVLEVEAGLCVL